MVGTFNRQHGLTLIEVLLVVAILGIVLALGVFNGRQALTGQQESAAVNSIRQASWQGATAAAARGSEVFMTREAGQLLLRLGGAQGEVLRREELPGGLESNLPEGTIIVFTPPGKVRDGSLPEPGQYWIGAGGREVGLEFSLIGEVRTR